MGNAYSSSPPDQFVVQSRSDFEKSIRKALTHQPTLIKTVVLPPGVDLDDPRLQYGEIMEETVTALDSGDISTWPDDVPFEVDVDARMIPPCWGRAGIPAHYAVYPNERFAGSKCGLCELSSRAKQEQGWENTEEGPDPEMMMH